MKVNILDWSSQMCNFEKIFSINKCTSLIFWALKIKKVHKLVKTIVSDVLCFPYWWNKIISLFGYSAVSEILRLYNTAISIPPTGECQWSKVGSLTLMPLISQWVIKICAYPCFGLHTPPFLFHSLANGTLPLCTDPEKIIGSFGPNLVLGIFIYLLVGCWLVGLVGLFWLSILNSLLWVANKGLKLTVLFTFCTMGVRLRHWHKSELL